VTSRAYLSLALGLLAAALSGCGPDRLVQPAPRESFLLVNANVSGTTVATVVIEVSAEDLVPSRVFNLVISNGTASGTITVPSGSARTITARAYDAGGVQTHSGSVTLDIQPGTNGTLNLRLSALVGDITIDVSLGSIQVAVSPASHNVDLSGTFTLTAVVTDDGSPVSTGTVTWATYHPGIATVASTGPRTAQVTGVALGQTMIVATYSGSAGAATVNVVLPALQVVASGLGRPVGVFQAPGDATRLFIVLQNGVIRVLENGTLLGTPFLDISAAVSDADEEGLLSMAFHPDYQSNGRFFVFYTDVVTGNNNIIRLNVSADPNVANLASVTPVMSLPHPVTRHNGGLLLFGPDGMLRIATGDAQNGPQARDRTSLHGKLLRIDVDGAAPYAIPPDNPYAGHATFRREIWAYGLRNPWRYAFDLVTGALYLTDVGEGEWEEVNVQPGSSPGGEDYGWDIMEGPECFTTPCDQTGLALPAFAYDHDGSEPNGCSITGGFVYRGQALPSLAGRYLYSDFCDGFVRSFRYDAGVVSDHRHHATLDAGFGVVAFGQDLAGELYLVSIGNGGQVLKLVPGT
jgi:glucose/arabinose dehydrogenase